jgi:hypothetical protein
MQKQMATGVLLMVLLRTTSLGWHAVNEAHMSIDLRGLGPPLTPILSGGGGRQNP